MEAAPDGEATGAAPAAPTPAAPTRARGRKKSAPTEPAAEKAPARRRSTTPRRKAAPAAPAEPPVPADPFIALGVPDTLGAALAAGGFRDPFPIQAASIPPALAGRDVCGRARTGSGKTLAFGLAVLARCGGLDGGDRPVRPAAVVLAPTRELAAQIAEVLEALAPSVHVKVGLAYGGTDRKAQANSLAGAAVIVATPGRLIDFVQAGAVDFGAVAQVVVDEADRMADLGFAPQVEWLFARMPRPRQTMLFSATLDGTVGTWRRDFLADPVDVSVDTASATPERLRHLFLGVHHMDKERVMAAIARAHPRSVVFCDTKSRTARVAERVRAEGVAVAALHGDLAQPARTAALSEFAAGKVRALVATDVAARGLHIDDVDVVIHDQPVTDQRAYLHRAGRTARAGASGVSVTLVEYNQHVPVMALCRGLGLTAKVVDVFSNDARLADVAAFADASGARPR